ncbi:hypothetical protein CCP3SC15_4240003 [Gammaproteobacteria bacterium]
MAGNVGSYALTGKFATLAYTPGSSGAINYTLTGSPGTYGIVGIDAIFSVPTTPAQPRSFGSAAGGFGNPYARGSSFYQLGSKTELVIPVTNIDESDEEHVVAFVLTELFRIGIL